MTTHERLVASGDVLRREFDVSSLREHDGKCDHDEGCERPGEYAVLSAAPPDLWMLPLPASLAFMCGQHLEGERIASLDAAQRLRERVAESSWLVDVLVERYPMPVGVRR